RGARRRGWMRVEEGELVAFVLQEPVLRVSTEVEAVRARGRVLAGDVALGDAVPEDDEPAGLVRRLRARVCLKLRADLRRDHHQTPPSSSRSGSAASQKPAERYFQPPSASTMTTTPSSSSAASFRAAWTTAPDETPAKIPSCSSSARRPASASAFETSSFRSSFAMSRIGGT